MKQMKQEVHSETSIDARIVKPRWESHDRHQNNQIKDGKSKMAIQD